MLTYTQWLVFREVEDVLAAGSKRKRFVSSARFALVHDDQLADGWKCEVTSEPPCTRCKRLRIQCVGYGERRLKFQDESQNYLAGRGKKTTVVVRGSPPSISPRSNSSVDTAADGTWPTVINKPLANILTSLTASLAHSIDSCDMDTCYNLSWNFGAFLSDVPRYLGTNKALDAAADALVVGYNQFCRSGYANANALCLEKYSLAISSLRHCLSTVEMACDPGTLCAIMIVMVVEVGKTIFRSHGSGYIL
jgi:hypothetical protein